jgi:chromosome segregation ATPase
LSPELKATLAGLPATLTGVLGAVSAVEADGSPELDSQRAELAANTETLQKQLDDRISELAVTRAELRARLDERRGQAQAQLEELQAQLESARFELASRIEGLQAQIAEIQARIEEITDSGGPGPGKP